MKQILLAALICVAWVLPAQAQETRGPDIRAVISQQIEAFVADDLSRAFGYASDDIRRVFRTPETFGDMVRQGYPMVYRPSAVWFRELRDVNGALWQTVEIQDRAGTFHLLAYEMVATESGWRIDGVEYLGKGPGMGA